MTVAYQPDPDPDSKAARTREEILEAAARAFSSNGIGQTRLSDVADLAGMKAGSLYYHFRSKDELIEVLLRESVGRTHAYVQRAVEELPPDASAHDRFRVAVHAHARAVMHDLDFAATAARMLPEVPLSLREASLQNEERAYGRYLGRLLSDVRGPNASSSVARPAQIMLLIIGALNSIVEWPDPLRSDLDGARDAIDLVLLEGILGPR